MASILCFNKHIVKLIQFIIELLICRYGTNNQKDFFRLILRYFLNKQESFCYQINKIKFI